MTDGLVLVGVAAAALLAGMAFGAVYFLLLWRGASGFIRAARDDGHPGAGLLLGFALRLALAGGALGLAIWAGAGAVHLLAATLGFTLARQVAIRRRPGEGREAP